MRNKFLIPRFIISLFFIYAFTWNAYAASLLRIACDQDSVDSEVFINGIFKGECPIDIQVKAGTILLKLLKKVDANYEQVYEQEIRIGDGISKKIEVKLSTPRLNAVGKRLQDKRIANEREESAKREEIRLANITKERLEAEKREEIQHEINKQLQNAAEAGNPNSMFRLGMRYENGFYIEKNLSSAFSWYLKAAQAGHAGGIGAVAAFYFNGWVGNDRDFEQARIWAEKAAALNDARAMSIMHLLYRVDPNLEIWDWEDFANVKNYEKIYEWESRALKAGSIHALTIQGQYYLTYSVKETIEEGIAMLKQAAEPGEDHYGLTSAMISLGDAYIKYKKDSNTAMTWFYNASEAGDDKAMLKIAEMYSDSIGVTKNEEKALEFFRKAAEKGNTEAINELKKRGLQ